MLPSRSSIISSAGHWKCLVFITILLSLQYSHTYTKYKMRKTPRSRGSLVARLHLNKIQKYKQTKRHTERSTVERFRDKVRPLAAAEPDTRDTLIMYLLYVFGYGELRDSGLDISCLACLWSRVTTSDMHFIIHSQVCMHVRVRLLVLNFFFSASLLLLPTFHNRNDWQILHDETTRRISCSP